IAPPSGRSRALGVTFVGYQRASRCANTPAPRVERPGYTKLPKSVIADGTVRKPQSRRPDSNRGPLHYECLESCLVGLGIARLARVSSAQVGLDLPSRGHISGHGFSAV